jgi:hypothetical protein
MAARWVGESVGQGSVWSALFSISAVSRVSSTAWRQSAEFSTAAAAAAVSLASSSPSA